MPRPTKAGVLGMARITWGEPVAATTVSLRMPAMMLKCKAPPTWGAQGSAACAKSWGLTAQTTTSAWVKEMSASGSAITPHSVASLSRWLARGSTTRN